MVKVVRIILFCGAVILTIISGFIFIKRLFLPYNVEGNYYDPVKSVNYTEQAVAVYGILFVICLVISIGLFLSIVKLASIKKVFRIRVKDTGN